MGHAFFEQIIASPEDLAEMDDAEETTLFEGYQYVPTSVYEAKTGELPGLRVPSPADPSREHWDEDDLPHRYPKLCARYDC
jgi:hypothetical protein